MFIKTKIQYSIFLLNICVFSTLTADTPADSPPIEGLVSSAETPSDSPAVVDSSDSVEYFLIDIPPSASNKSGTSNPSGASNNAPLAKREMNLDPEEVQLLLENRDAICSCINECLNCKVHGKVYIGIAAAYGRIEYGDVSVISSGILAGLIDVASNTHTTTGGLCGRGFVGAYAEITDTVALGGEVGFTYYPSAKARTYIPFSGKIKSEAYGADLVGSLFLFPIPQLFVAIKPGIQLGYQKNNIALDLKPLFSALGITSLAGIPLGNGDFKDRYVITQLLPEVIVSTGWWFKRCWGTDIEIEFFYQHVWGQDSAPPSELISSRDAIGLTFEFIF